jgi:hypothetical protein
MRTLAVLLDLLAKSTLKKFLGTAANTKKKFSSSLDSLKRQPRNITFLGDLNRSAAMNFNRRAREMQSFCNKKKEK